MEDYSYLHIALRGEQDAVTTTLYSLGGVANDPIAWGRVTVEPGAAMSRFLNASECYVMQSMAGKGHFFSYITTTERGDYRMICVLVDDGCSLTGRRLNSMFEQLKQVLVDEERLDDDAVRQALRQADVPAEPVRLNSWKVQPAPEGARPQEAAYRTYISQSDLETIFSFPAQPEYADYRCVLVVSATTSLRPGVKMPRITVPIRKLYSVVCPEGVTASDEQVYDGDTLSITYEREGFNRHTEQITVGQPSAYTKYEGSTLHIRTATQTGIRFVRRVGINVISSKGKPVSGYTLTVNGRFLPTVEPVIELTEKDLSGEDGVEIAVQSTNFRPLKVKKSVEELLAADELELELQPVEQGFTLRLDFGDGRVFEQQIKLEKNTPEYTRLHSGYFHGFRAMRQVTEDNSEIYNVDVRPDAPHIGVGQTTAAGNAGNNQAPVYENVSSEQAPEERRPEIDTTRPTVGGYDNESDDYADDDDETPSRRRGWIKWTSIGVGIIAVITALALFLPRGTEFDVTPAEGTAEGASGEDAAVEQPLAPLTPDEQADVDYLNNNPVWKVDAVKSPMGTSLMQAIADGDIAALVNNDYFAVGDRCKNAKAAQLADLVWRAKGSPNEASNRSRLRKGIVDGEINLHKLVDNVAKVRPSENPNTEPRPKKN